MSHQPDTQTTPNTASDNSKGKWRAFKIFGAIAFVIILALKLAGGSNSLDLELTRRNLFDINHDGRAMDLVNTGTGPVSITKIIINDRSDCEVSELNFVNPRKSMPWELKVGDKITLRSSCRIIRATIETDHASSTYSFKGD